MGKQNAGKIQFYWISFMTGLFTLWACINMILSSYLLSNSRLYIDRVLSVWANRLLNLIKLTIEVKGISNLEKFEDKPIIIMSNHSSLYDIPIAVKALNFSVRFMAKKELYKIPIFGSALKRAEFISIDRQNHDEALKNLQKAKELMLGGITLWVSPEGTRSKNGKLSRFKRGGFHLAIDTSAMIVPIAVKGIHNVQAGKELKICLNQKIEVEICQPVDASQYTTSNKNELVEEVRDRMLTALHQKD